MSLDDDFREGEFPTEWTQEALEKAIETRKNRLLFGNLGRTEFETFIFTEPRDRWPVGHLVDHRVSMPDRLARSYLGADDVELAALLKRFLCSSEREHASDMVAGALGVSPLFAARTLIDLRNRSEELFVSLLCSRLHEVWPLYDHLGLRWHSVRHAMRTMLLYYGALDLQLIAARSRAFETFDLGAISGVVGAATGPLLNGWDQRSRAIVYASNVAKGTRPRGAISSRFEATSATGKMIQTMLKLSDGTAMPAGLSDLLQRVSPKISQQALPAVEKWRATAATNKRAKPEGNDGSKGQPVDSRTEMPTLFAGVPAGSQIAYASLRLELLVSRANDLLPKHGATKRHFAHWNQALLPKGANKPSLLLYFVNQAVIMEDPQTCAANLDLEKTFSRWCGHDTAGQANSLIKSIKAGRLGEVPARAPVSANGELTDSALYDVLPDLRLGITRPSLSTSNVLGRRKRRNGLPTYTQRHGIWHAPAKLP